MQPGMGDGGISRHCRLDGFPASKKVSKEADPSAQWEGAGELIFSRAALVGGIDILKGSLSGCLRQQIQWLPWGQELEGKQAP